MKLKYKISIGLVSLLLLIVFLREVGGFNFEIVKSEFQTESTLERLNGKDRNIQPVKYLCIIPMLKNSPEPIKLTTVDPRAKEMIKDMKPYRDSARVNAKDTIGKD